MINGKTSQFFFQRKIVNILLSMILAYVLGAQKNRLIETVCISPDQNGSCIIEFITLLIRKVGRTSDSMMVPT